HTRADFYQVVQLFEELELALSPTFVAFTPWTTCDGYLDLLAAIAELDLVRSVAPVQLAIRLLIPPGSRLLELQAIRERVGPLDQAALVYPWSSFDPRVDELQVEVQRRVQQGAEQAREELFRELWVLAHIRAQRQTPPLPLIGTVAAAEMSEPWYCCAEPTDGQLAQL
ncbi:MAG: CUAEP/CCAEP-tail radical SAM protein, partial [Lysobacterales bacterium]